MNLALKSALTVAITLLSTSSLLAKVASTTVEDLADRSELIVVAKVEKVSKPLIGKRYAKATVTEVWKGDQAKSVEFLASPTWTCDISDAKKGETVVLFLVKSKESRSYQIAHSGRGRLVQRTINGKTCVDIWGDVRFPKDTPVASGSDKDWIRAIEISTLRELVKKPEPNKK